MKNIRIINIIKEHWKEFKETNGNKLPGEIRDDIYESVEKALYCGDTSKGYAKYICMNCGNTHSIGFTCKSKACLKCCRKYALDWADKQLSKMLNIPTL